MHELWKVACTVVQKFSEKKRFRRSCARMYRINSWNENAENAMLNSFSPLNKILLFWCCKLSLQLSENSFLLCSIIQKFGFLYFIWLQMKLLFQYRTDAQLISVCRASFLADLWESRCKSLLSILISLWVVVVTDLPVLGGFSKLSSSLNRLTAKETIWRETFWWRSSEQCYSWERLDEAL